MFKKIKKLYFKIYHLFKLIGIFILIFGIKNIYAEEILLPEDYVRVPYIESTRTQYINTGINANSNIKIEIDVISPPVTKYDAVLYGGGEAWMRNYIQGELDLDSTFAYKNNFYVIRNIEQKQNSIIIQDKNKIYIDGNLKYTFTASTFDTQYPIYLFAYNRGGTVGEFGSYKINYCKIYDNDIIVRDFVSVYQYSTETYGLYDVVSETFFTNNGTGIFTTDPEFVIPDPNPDHPTNDEVYSSFISLYIDKIQYLTEGFTSNSYLLAMIGIIFAWVVLELFLRILHLRGGYKK